MYTITMNTMEKIVYFQPEKYMMRVHESGPTDVNGQHDKYTVYTIAEHEACKIGYQKYTILPDFLHDCTRFYTIIHCVKWPIFC